MAQPLGYGQLGRVEHLPPVGINPARGGDLKPRLFFFVHQSLGCPIGMR